MYLLTILFALLWGAPPCCLALGLSGRGLEWVCCCDALGNGVRLVTHRCPCTCLPAALPCVHPRLHLRLPGAVIIPHSSY